MNNEEIIEHLKEYLQNKIDNGEHKIFYNDLFHDEKVIDVINALEDLKEENNKQKEENNKQKEVLHKIKEYAKEVLTWCTNEEITDEIANHILELSEEIK